MTWVEDATKYEDKQCLQRDVTEVDVSKRGAGRTCLMFIVTPVEDETSKALVVVWVGNGERAWCNQYVAMVKIGNECLLGNYMSTRGKLPWQSFARKCCSNQVSSGGA